MARCGWTRNDELKTFLILIMQYRLALKWTNPHKFYRERKAAEPAINH